MQLEEAMTQQLDDHIVMLQSMGFSPYKKPFEDRLAKWDTTLNLVSEQALHAVQRGRISVPDLAVLTACAIPVGVSNLCSSRSIATGPVLTMWYQGIMQAIRQSHSRPVIVRGLPQGSTPNAMQQAHTGPGNMDSLQHM